MHPRKPKDVAVKAWREQLTIPTYEPAPPDRNPMFLEKRVYQGSSGRVYPLPFTDRIAERPFPRRWQGVWLENEFLRVLVLPELGGRIHRILDKTNQYDLLYHQTVIKPALVGLAGPWISGGIELNWPQHHRPATFLPVDTEIEPHADGSVTVWCSDHDPLCRMKGMHGVCLHPGRAYVELKVRATNRTQLTQTFLWWANVATRVHEGYQSFFPPDVYYVADHARRSMSAYPLAQGAYYGVDYGARGRQGVPPGEQPRLFKPPYCVPAEMPGSKPEPVLEHRPQTPTEQNARGSDFALRSSPGLQTSTLPAYAANDLSFYANIPVPTSYMCMGSQEDFFGGYDYHAQAGIVHVANHHIAPGKKQWTWGNHEFGYAWDRNLTDPDARGVHWPYIELMAGVYTDNQPDFSFLQPGETKSWSQYWYPIQQIGPAQQANLDAAVSLRCGTRQVAEVAVGVAVTRPFAGAVITLSRIITRGRARAGRSGRLARFTRDLAPGKPFVASVTLPDGVRETDLELVVTGRDGREIIAYQPQPRPARPVPPPATEPPEPEAIAGTDELFVTGLHLEQYRHATRCPTRYWREALRRDPRDARCNNALGLWHLRRGEFTTAERHFRHAIERLTRRNANPADGEPFYNLGLALRFQADKPPTSAIRDPKSESRPMPAAGRAAAAAPGDGRTSDFEIPSDFGLRTSDLWKASYAAFYKATWNQAWAGAAYLALAELDCRRRDWVRASEHAHRAAQASAGSSRTLCLRAIALRKLGEANVAQATLETARQTDPLDWWTRHLLGEALSCDTQTVLDLVLDFARAGLFAEAIRLLEPRASANLARRSVGGGDPRELGTAPLVHYHLGWLHLQLGHHAAARAAFRKAASAPPDYCFPARLEEIAILETAIATNPADARARCYLGNLLYDRRRHEEAVQQWEGSARLDPNYSVVWRNLGIGYHNVRRSPAQARQAYDRAFQANPADARLLYERDQLWKRLGVGPRRRLRELEQHPDLVQERDDLSIELCALYNQVGRHADALTLLETRHFQPWEGGEGGPLGQWVRTHLALGREALGRRDGGGTARHHFEAALTAPANLGEAKHLLANQSHVHYWLGCALDSLGESKAARRCWRTAATFRGDFLEMSVRAFSDMTYYSALSWERLGRKDRAQRLLRDLLRHARQRRRQEARIDYFATSLPTMLLFEDDLQARQETAALFLEGQALLGLGRLRRGQTVLRRVLDRDPNHALASDLWAGVRP